MGGARKPAVAGMFYPGDPQVLAAVVDALLAAAHAKRPARTAKGSLRAVIVPHAGYMYSGPTAAEAYDLVAERVAAGEVYQKVVIVGPTHRVPVYGVAYPTATEFLTPLGAAALVPDLAATLAGVADAAANDATHRDEHAVEVQIPFLQKVLPGVPIIPLNAGQATGVQVADVLDHLIDDETLLVISSDLSHYLSYDDANQIDAITLGQILSLAGPLISEQACGATPINGVLELARRHDWVPVLLDACNSGDTAGDKGRVVGYCAVAFYQGAVSLSETASDEGNVFGPLPSSAGPVVLANARAAIEQAVGAAPQTEPQPWGDWANLQRGVFVTLNKHGELRGCIGTLSDDRPLSASIVANAANAALRDPRFAPVTAGELGDIEVEVSVLSEAEPVLISDSGSDSDWGHGSGEADGQAHGLRPPRTEAEAATALVPGVDGVILKRGWNHATFLPQVWEQLPDPVEFLAHLRAKAGLPARAWDDRIVLERYRVQAFEEVTMRAEE
ncbi:MAG: AmmeMemoRadiSam system protein B [Cellulomonadaceae bacterium]|jgi:AmmeMemoRadiSam system protein B|nr:AmmeMemoRadiSam system protein B [Cellulomonadaceae bacterium]